MSQCANADIQLLNVELYTEPDPNFPEKMNYFLRLPDHCTIDVGFGSTEILNGGEEHCMVKRKVIEEKIRDFTMEELEEIVGGKIRIVKEK